MIDVGDIFGCLEVIEFTDDYEKEVNYALKQVARHEWMSWMQNRAFKSWFIEEYKLTKEEANLYIQEKEMPDTFVEKFLENPYCQLRAPFLYHKAKPKTYDDLVEAYQEKKLIKIRCIKCGREFLTDERSLSCVKWQKCLKDECSKSTIQDKKIDSSESLYEWDEEKTSLQVLGTQLERVKELSIPLTYYNSFAKGEEKLQIAYISDIHLLHHLSAYNKNEEKMLQVISKKLYESSKESHIVIFNGDTASDPMLALKMYKYFVKQFIFYDFKEFSRKIQYYKRIAEKYFIFENKNFQPVESVYLKRLSGIEGYIVQLCNRLVQEYGFDIMAFFSYQNRYRKEEILSKAFEIYKGTNGYKKQNIEKRCEIDIEKIILQIEKLVERIPLYKRKIREYNERVQKWHAGIVESECRYGKSIFDINLSDYKLDYNLEKHTGRKIFVVLGNHEFIKFANIHSGVSFYRGELQKLGITLLHNNYYVGEYGHTEKLGYVIYGGTGFAKYNQHYNADNTICCPNFTREDEIQETETFERGYQEALAYAKEKNMCFICASHYPIESCLNNVFDKETVYFTGHNHINTYIYKEDKVLYADNQIGYRSNQIYFKIAKLGAHINPYAMLKDGLYETTIEKYLDFYRYIGEAIKGVGTLYRRCEYNKASLYVVKHRGYYGFFILNPVGKSKGISIVNGGTTKKITSNTDLKWICENFDIVLAKYLQLLLPLRSAQEEVSKELQMLGLSGQIHGIIVDIDYFHHIMVNPIDGTIRFYYSPKPGWIQYLDTFEDVVNSLEEYSSYRIRDKQQYKEMLQRKDCLLTMIAKDYMIGSEELSGKIIKSDGSLQVVSRKEGAYGVSRKVNPLQRLFSGRVLRDFDLRLTETKQQEHQEELKLTEMKRQEHQRDLLVGRVLCFDGICYKVIKDDGRDFIVIEKIKFIGEMKNNKVVLLGKRKRVSVEELELKIKNNKNWNTYWLD